MDGAILLAALSGAAQECTSDRCSSVAACGSIEASAPEVSALQPLSCRLRSCARVLHRQRKSRSWHHASNLPGACKT